MSSFLQPRLDISVPWKCVLRNSTFLCSEIHITLQIINFVSNTIWPAPSTSPGIWSLPPPTSNFLFTLSIQIIKKFTKIRPTSKADEVNGEFIVRITWWISWLMGIIYYCKVVKYSRLLVKWWIGIPRRQKFIIKSNFSTSDIVIVSPNQGFQIK